MTQKLLNLIDEKYPLKEIDCAEFSVLKANGMIFNISAYRADGLGHVSVMRASGFFGLMKMDTLIINPTELDMPLYSYDRIFAMGNDTLIVELYDTLLTEYSQEGMEAAKSEFSDIAERDAGVHWYDSIKLSSSISKKGKKACTRRLDALTLRHFEEYIRSTDSSVSDRDLKAEKARAYVNGLLTKGGPSTDVFKKSLGEDKTRELFESVLFGTE